VFRWASRVPSTLKGDNVKSALNLKLQLANAGLAAALAVAATSQAQTLPKEGRYDYTSCWSGASNIISHLKSHTAFSYEMIGTVLSTAAGGLYDKNSFRCVGMNTIFDGKLSGNTVCESVDADGDKSLTHFVTSSDGKAVRTHLAGTGKYEGMVSSGTTTPLGPFPVVKAGAFQNCNRQTGTYKMK
jgi:hypothetical protein